MMEAVDNFWQPQNRVYLTERIIRIATSDNFWSMGDTETLCGHLF